MLFSSFPPSGNRIFRKNTHHSYRSGGLYTSSCFTVIKRGSHRSAFVMQLKPVFWCGGSPAARRSRTQPTCSFFFSWKACSGPVVRRTDAWERFRCAVLLLFWTKQFLKVVKGWLSSVEKWASDGVVHWLDLIDFSTTMELVFDASQRSRAEQEKLPFSLSDFPSVNK